MKINLHPNIYNSYSNLSSYNVGFGAMKKSQFKGLDLCCVNQYKVAIEKFKTYEDFESWAKNKTQELLNDEKLKSPPFDIHKVHIDKPIAINEWVDGMMGENSKYKDKPVTTFYVLDSIFKNLEYTKATMPAVYNEEILDSTLDEINTSLEKNPKSTFDFEKIYRKNLQKKYITEEKIKQGLPADYSKPFWIRIPAWLSSPDDFSENIKKLKAMSSPLWCICVDYKAKEVLAYDDFYICAKGDESKIGMRTDHGGVYDVQGRLNDFYFPYKYSPVVEDKIAELGIPVAKESPFPPYRYYAQRAAEMWNEIPEVIKNKDYKAIMEYQGLEPKELEDGLFEIKEFKGFPKELNYFKKYGLNQDDYMKKIKIIRGDARFDGEKYKTTYNIEEIGGNVQMYNSELESLSKLKKVGGNLNLYSSKVVDLGELEEIGGDFSALNVPLRNLGKLKNIKGNVYCSDLLVKFLPQLESVKNIDFLQERYDNLY